MRRIGFLIDLRLFRSGAGLCAEVPMVNFALGFRAHFDEVVLIARIFDDVDPPDAPYPIPREGVRVAALPAYARIGSLYTRPTRYWPGIERTLRATLPDLSALWLNFGHPVSHRALALCERHPDLRPFAVVRGAYDRDAAIRTQGPAPLQWAAGLVMRLQMRAFARRARRRALPCFAFGDEMTARLRAEGLDVRGMVSSLLSESDLDRQVEPDPELDADLLVVGRLGREKGVDVLLDALPGLTGAGGRPARLRIVGSGERDAELHEQAERLGILDRVHFDGHVSFGPALFARYASAQLVVIPSRTEGAPKTAYEAMAFGRPLLCTRVGGLPEVIGRNGERGVLVQPDDPEALRVEASALLADAERRRQMGERARAFAGEITMERQINVIARRVLAGEVV